MADVKLTWLGHSTLLIESPEGKKIMVDPWLEGNPSCPDQCKPIDNYAGIDVLLLTHGHFDHIGESVELCKAYAPTVCCTFELGTWISQQGVENVSMMNKGGTQEIEGIKFTMTTANHSSGIVTEDGTIIYAGEPNGYVIEFENGTKIYISGDTNVFGDMALIAELYEPSVAILPIGDHFTMGPLEAAKAIELLNVNTVVPVHFGTFPLLTGTPEALRQRVASSVNIINLAAGDSIHI